MLETTSPYALESYQDFFTDAEEIRSLMTTLLGNVHGKTILEPCVGRGAFLSSLHGEPSLVDAIDIDNEHLTALRKQEFPWARIQQGDFLNQFVIGGLFNNTIRFRSDYDAIICNPPYGLRFSLLYRKLIKMKFPHLYARESYGLFLYFGINCLKDNGRYVFIIPDTFLTSRNHRPLREFILSTARPTHIIQFDSSRFGSVHFGYGSLCIIAGKKQALSPKHTLTWVDARNSNHKLSMDLFKHESSINATFLRYTVADGWVSPLVSSSLALNVPAVPLGDIAECRTGIYTGNNVAFCGFDKKYPPKRANGHPVNWAEKVFLGRPTTDQHFNGISGNKDYVPLIRGGHREPFEPTRWAIKWSKDAVQFYKNDKKARFQNADFYFNTGVAVPMVTSGRLSASLFSNSVFDQGVVGIFPADKGYLSFLLIYLNSTFATKLKKAINPGANNSANYIKRIPIPVLSPSLLKKADSIVQKARKIDWETTAKARDALLSESLNLGELPRKVTC